MLRIKKVLNSSVVLATDEHSQEFILLGKGIGYGKKAGTVIGDSDFNQVFVTSPNPSVEQLLTTVASTSPQLIELTQTIVNRAAEQLQTKLSDSLYVALLDHLKLRWNVMPKESKLPIEFIGKLKRITAMNLRLAMLQ
ncbi:CAT RNA binding domain-containing protein [Lactiplantibacillus pentosus]|uniref:CAT RNA binding domain-containing protein n=1 Tax=Lactiplantibacillus pentosus TaxID=1589 RepID=UPI001CDB1B8C|nr:CAT RNA binding domain-containing protein [Lactiplantibacillus pentosus]